MLLRFLLAGKAMEALLAPAQGARMRVVLTTLAFILAKAGGVFSSGVCVAGAVRIDWTSCWAGVRHERRTGRG